MTRKLSGKIEIIVYVVFTLAVLILTILNEGGVEIVGVPW
ncbi:MAG: hypothetical protein K0S45_1702 [Nitrospira sp.]|jgi:hypothetical protein|nr:hypothetical protein [Nitrospira sp.]